MSEEWIREDKYGIRAVLGHINCSPDKRWLWLVSPTVEYTRLTFDLDMKAWRKE